MNTKLLQQIADYVRTVPPEEFAMDDWEKCVIAHSEHKGLISKCFFVETTNLTDNQAVFIACQQWYKVDNTPEGAAKRIEYLIEYGLPHDWRLMMEGAIPLCY